MSSNGILINFALYQCRPLVGWAIEEDDDMELYNYIWSKQCHLPSCMSLVLVRRVEKRMTPAKKRGFLLSQTCEVCLKYMGERETTNFRYIEQYLIHGIDSVWWILFLQPFVRFSIWNMDDAEPPMTRQKSLFFFLESDRHTTEISRKGYSSKSKLTRPKMGW